MAASSSTTTVAQAPPNLHQSLLPTLPRQATYAATGLLAGLATVPVDWGVTRLLAGPTAAPPSFRAFARSHARTVGPRAAVRFWGFDVAKSHLVHTGLPVWITGGLAGAAGGVAEVLAHSAVQRRRPGAWEATAQASRLFLCFGGYTYLSTRFHGNDLPPRPFAWCWLLGATAGFVGVGMVAAVEGAKGRGLVGAAMKGAGVVGKGRPLV